VEHVGEGKMAVMPLFVAITAEMDIAFADESGGEGGGPPRGSNAGKDITRRSFSVS
jgi:hypothetical protein